MIIVAMNNSNIKSAIDGIYKGDVYKYDLCYMEDVIKLISQEKQKNDINLDNKSILITKDNLSGQLNAITYVKQIRLIAPKLKIIFFVSELTQEYKEFLFANEIFNIINSESISVEKLQQYIESDRYVIYDNTESQKVVDNVEKKQDVKLNVITNIAKKEDINNIKVITKKKIAVYGTSGSGKSYLASMLSQEIVKKLKVKTIILDMDIENASLDIFNNLDFNINSISQIVEDIDKEKDINQSIVLNSIKQNKNSKISYITNNCSLYECQNKLSVNYYEKIYKGCEKIFDYTIIDLPTSPFIDVTKYTLTNSDDIIFVINPNYVSLRQAVKKLDMIENLWNIPKEKIYIIINKMQKNSLDYDQIKSILEEYRIIEIVDFDDSLEGYINGANKIRMNITFNNYITKVLLNRDNIDNEKKFKISKNKKDKKLRKDSSKVVLSSIISNIAELKKDKNSKEYSTNDSESI